MIDFSNAVFGGTLRSMFSSVADHFDERRIDSRQLQSVWLTYNGPDCNSFKCYTRFGADRIVLANILGTAQRADEQIVRKGRMPKIIAACLAVKPKLVVESVVSPPLRTYLTGVGFKQTPEYDGSYYKVRDADSEAP